LLFLVISRPAPARPSAVAPRRLAFWRWIEPKLRSGQALWAYPKVGRGVATAFDVRSHEELHRLLNEWSEIVPAEFDVHPLVDRAKAKLALAQAGRRRG
jgi:hypothetical protein